MAAPYHDRPWAGLDPGPGYRPFLFERRRAFLLSAVRPGDRVLDLGCGTGEFTAALAEANTVPVGAEVSTRALELARARHPSLDFRDVPPDGPLPFADDAFDVVWLGGVIGHVLDTDGFLDEVARVLGRDGRVVLSTEYHGRVKLLAMALGLFPRHFDPRGQHIRFYSRRSLREVLTGHGFEDIAIRTVGGPTFLRSTMLAIARCAS
jgi:SAM-dependent methyltransferase